jgi:hypothetical protein
MTCRIFHRWTKWESDLEECPDGEVAVYEHRSRRCKRRRCDMIEEDRPRCVSLSPAVVRGLTP